MNRQQRRTASKSGKLSGSSSSTATAFAQAGLQHLQSGRLTQAENCFRQALTIDANHADSFHLMGAIAFQRQQYDVAVEWIAKAIRHTPTAEYLSSLGTALQHQGRREEALKAYDKALLLKPEDAELWKNLANVLIEMDRFSEAELGLQHALKLNPRYLDAANIYAILLFNSGRLNEAVDYLNLSNELQPNQAATLRTRALSLQRLKKFEEALSDNIRALTLEPDNADTQNNLGSVLQSLGRLEESLTWFDKALERLPNHVEALNNKAFSLSQVHRFEEAFACYDRSRAIDPNNPLTEWNLSLLHMLTGNFEAGWIGRESRWKAPLLGMVDPKFPQPLWLGDRSIEGKTILLHADEGIGDSIQFARYIPMVAALGARVILAVASSVQPLLSGVSGVSQCLPIPSALPAFDLHCPMSSLPLAFSTRIETIPSAVPYLPPAAHSRRTEWESRLGPRNKLRAGLVWSGNPGHMNDRNRSIPLHVLSSILDLDATFVSLQKDPRPDDKAVLLERAEIVDLTAHLTDFVETAALISCLDLVITVDTSVAHLAGALGCSTWVLLPYAPDYRWLLDRDDSPWYPTMRLFRQTETREYVSVLDRVRSELLTLAAAKQSLSPAKVVGK
jgi:tetratricopeptide (TPR) repeat protein